jgi:mono/diheme cytochrome c family protein
MKRIANLLAFNVLLAILMISCHNASEKKMVQSISVAQLTTQNTAIMPHQPQEKDLPGKAVYLKNCLTCHQMDGSGVPNMHPPLGPGSWVGKDPKELIAIMMKGLSGKIEVNNEVYKNFMPSQAKLIDEELADVLTYIRSSFGNNFGPVSAEMVSKIRNGR